MKRTALALTLIIALLVSTVAGQFISLARANFFPGFHLPAEPVTTTPTITVESPSPKQNYDSTTVWLNFTVNKPDTWVNPLYDSLAYIVGRVISYHYVLDGRESQTVPVNEEFHLISYPENVETTRSFTQNLTTTNGSHSIIIVLECETTYRGETKEAYVPVTVSSETVNFTIDTISPSILVIMTGSGASLAVVSVGLLVYFRKRKKKVTL